METLITITGFLFIFLAIFSFFRINNVSKFRINVIDLSSEYCKKTNTNGFEKFYYKLPSFKKMLFSYKPLKLESYFTEDEIKELKKWSYKDIAISIGKLKTNYKLN